jgi:thiol-disulfide isomerase/thioredoxin
MSKYIRVPKVVRAFFPAMLCSFALLLITACTPTTTNAPTSNAAITVTPLTGRAVNAPDFIESDPQLVRVTGRPQVVEFFAYWCTSCQEMRPTMHELQDEYADRIDFLYLNIDNADTQTARTQLAFAGLRPTIVFLDSSGNEITRLVGVHPKETVQEILNNMAGSGG